MKLLSLSNRVFLVAAAWLLLLAGIAGSLGQYHWIAGLFTHFVPQYTIIGGILAFLLLLDGRKYLSLMLFIFAAYHAYMMEPLWKKEAVEPASVVDNITILQYNVNKNNANISAISDWIKGNSTRFDMVVLFELTDSWDDAIISLEEDYPFHFVELIRGKRKLGVFSKMEIKSFNMQPFRNAEGSIAFLQATTERFGLPLELSMIHPPPPVDRERFVRRNSILLETASLLKNRVKRHNNNYHMIIGDFNITRWSPLFMRMQELTGLKDAQEGKGHMGTWPSFLGDKFGIAIDHMLISPEINVISRVAGPNLGSDHLPVITTLELPLLNGQTE